MELQKVERQELAKVGPEIDLPRMYNRALELGPEGVQMLKELNVLRREVEAERAEKAAAAAMLAARAEMAEIVKTWKNESNNSKFARLEDIDRMAFPVYSAHGFTLGWSEGECAIPGWTRIVCEVSHIGGHKETKFLQGPMDDTGPKGTKNKTGIQGMGSTWSYLQRRLLAMIFNIRVVGEDNDGRNTQSVGKRDPMTPAKAQPTAPEPESQDQAKAAAKAARGRLWELLEPVRGDANTWEIAVLWLRHEKILKPEEKLMTLTAAEVDKIHAFASVRMDEMRGTP
jgi:hypothetical protein